MKGGCKIKSIKGQMIAVLMIFALTLFGVLGFLVFRQLMFMPEFIQEKHLNVVEARADELSKELKGIQDIVEIAAYSSVVKSMHMEEIQGYLPHLMIPDKIRNMTISDAEGNAWTTYEAYIDISEQEQFQRIFSYNESSHLSEPFDSPYIEENIPIITIARSVVNDQGEKVGLVNAVVSIGFIEEILNTIDMEDSGVAFIINGEGGIVSHPDPEIGIHNNVFDFLSGDQDSGEILLSAEDTGFIICTNHEGEEYLSVYTEIKGTPGWKMVMSLPLAVAYQQYYSVINYILWILVGGLVVITIFAYFYGNTLSKPILALKSVFESAAGGNLNVEAKTSWPNEFGKTGEAFNTMLSQIKKLTYRDPVTGLYNQNSFMMELKQRLEENRGLNKKQYLLLVSIDNFKRIDSITGHGSGDEVLKILARRIGSFIQEEELIGRYNGDEFLLYLQVENEEAFLQRLNKLQKLYYHRIYLLGIPYRLKTSIGIRRIQEPNRDLSEKIKQVSVAKQRVKDLGGNGYEFYNREFEKEILQEQQMEEALFNAIENKRLFLLYQPIVSIEEDRVVGHEALLRWDHEIYGKIPIPKVIALAEKRGMIIEIGAWILNEACKQNQAWIDKGYGSLSMAVNFSALQMADGRILDTIKNSVEKNCMDAKLLNIEITETVAMNQVDQKVDLMKKIKDTGVNFSIDDFGTGYSSLSYFTNFPIDILKIDRSFIRNMLIDENAHTIITIIIEMAKAMDLKIVAEGVETKEQLEALKSLGCTYYQGYLMSKPELPEECEKILIKDK